MNPSEISSQNKIYLAPLQGFTDFAFRTAFSELFGKPDAAFSPFIETHEAGHKKYRDVIPAKNTGNNLIPQLLGNETSEMMEVITELHKMGYPEVNLNLGCPYPMVTRKTMGAGLLRHSGKIDELLNNLFKQSPCRISVKMRLGLTEKTDWKEIVPILNRYSLTEVIIHPRTASQMYKGEPDMETFIEMAAKLTPPVCYNGNIFSMEDFQLFTSQMPTISRWMIGRGLIANPLLINEIKTGNKSSATEILRAIEKLHDRLFNINSQHLSGESHLLNKMKPYWVYFSTFLQEKRKGLKKIKKSTTLNGYLNACQEVF